MSLKNHYLNIIPAWKMWLARMFGEPVILSYCGNGKYLMQYRWRGEYYGAYKVGVR